MSTQARRRWESKGKAERGPNQEAVTACVWRAKELGEDSRMTPRFKPG